jgi:hypothetical protein
MSIRTNLTYAAVDSVPDLLRACVECAMLLSAPPPFPEFLSGCCGLQLKTEGGAENGEQHSGVAAEDRAATDG